jgi:hypothetical protein
MKVIGRHPKNLSISSQPTNQPTIMHQLPSNIDDTPEILNWGADKI